MMNQKALDPARPLMVKKIEQLDKHTLGIEWTDGHQSKWRLSHLRRQCPCASCVNEYTHEPILDPKSVDDDIMATTIQSVGRYALSVNFSDGHDTGIFTFTRLREICQCDECLAAKDNG